MALTQDKFQDLERDIDDTGKAINTKAVINPRYGEPFYSLPLAVQKVMETGGFEPFLTEAQLLASTPTISPKAAKALDTKKIWYWGKYDESETVDSWHDTGLSELDQANDFTKERIDLKPLINHVFSLQDKFGNLAFGVTKNGSAEIPKLLAGNSLTEKKNIGIYAHAWADSHGNVVLGILKNGFVQIPKLISNETPICSASSIKTISVKDSDTIMHIGDSMTASHYCVQDKSHVSQLSQMSPFRHVNYGLSDDTLLRMQNRIINDVQTLGSSLKSAKPKYLFIHSYANDRPFANADIRYYQENMRRLIDTAMSYGVQPVIVGYFLLNSVLHQAVKAVADEYQIPVVWSDVLNKQIGFYDGATLFHEWHVGTRTNCLFGSHRLNTLSSKSQCGR